MLLLCFRINIITYLWLKNIGNILIRMWFTITNILYKSTFHIVIPHIFWFMTLFLTCLQCKLHEHIVRKILKICSFPRPRNYSFSWTNKMRIQIVNFISSNREAVNFWNTRLANICQLILFSEKFLV